MSGRSERDHVLDPGDPLLAAVYESVLVLMSNHDRVESGLAAVAGLVARNLKPADGAGIALLEGDHAVVRGGSSVQVDRSDDTQYGLGEGPCVTAVTEGRPIRTGSLRRGGSPWPRFAAAVQPLDVGSVLSLPLRVDGTVTGSINIYARADDAFTARDEADAARFAGPVAAALGSTQAARRAASASASNEQLRQDHALVDTAVRFLRRRHGLTIEAAAAQLLRRAAQEDRPLAATAADLLAELDEEDDPR